MHKQAVCFTDCLVEGVRVGEREREKEREKLLVKAGDYSDRERKRSGGREREMEGERDGEKNRRRERKMEGERARERETFGPVIAEVVNKMVRRSGKCEHCQQK